MQFCPSILPGTLLCGVVSLVLGVVPAGAQPSFDCSKADGSVEELICQDESLAALDRELAEVYPKALANLPEDERSTARTVQRGWISGRNDCWKSDDVAQCVRDEYEIRITELQVSGGLVEVPDYTAFECEDGKPLWATFYGNTKRPVAVLTHGDDQILAYPSRAGSGAKYEGRNVVYWEHQGEVSLTWVGEETTCKKTGG